MSGKLDQSLDEILTQRKAAGGRRRSARRVSGRPAPAAPAGGIQKATKPARPAGKPAATKGAGAVGESKIMVSNLVSFSTRMCMLVSDHFH
jgi:THO complex subunit 4